METSNERFFKSWPGLSDDERQVVVTEVAHIRSQLPPGKPEPSAALSRYRRGMPVHDDRADLVWYAIVTELRG